MFFQQGALNVLQIPRFSSFFYFQFSKQTRQKHWYLQCFDKTACKKARCFEPIFNNFSAHAPPFKKRSFFTLLLPPLIRTQEGVKSGQIAKLHLNSTFCLSQSLPQSCNTKNWVSCLPKCCKFRCFMNVPCILPAKKVPPPQLKLTVLVPPERHALLHLRCGRIYVLCIEITTQCPIIGEISGLTYPSGAQRGKSRGASLTEPRGAVIQLELFQFT